MREYVGLAVLANWVRMLRSGTDGAILLTDDDEVSFYQRCTHDKASVLATSGLALNVLTAVEATGIEGVVATVRGSASARSSVFRPSLGDVASLLLASGSLDIVVEEVAGQPWVGACLKEIGPLRERAVTLARPLSAIHRALCLASAEAPTLGALADTVVDWNAFAIDWSAVTTVANSYGLSEESVDVCRDIIPTGSMLEELQTLDGNDAVEVVAAAIRGLRPRGIVPNRQIEEGALCALLRLAFKLEELEADDLFVQMRRWEYLTGRRYPLLKNWRSLDPLQTVWDQRYWRDDLDWMLKLVGSESQVACFKMDLDDFKPVNTLVGHAGGDESLRLYCRIVKDVAGRVGEVYRRGGDEVVAFVPFMHKEAALALAEEMRRRIESEMATWGHSMGLAQSPTASIGVVLCSGNVDADTVVASLDEVQEQAKRQGKNRVVCRDLDS
jgi:diguanylate cyclase (GGDEF)-like protein